jgi:hypothetical protein
VRGARGRRRARPQGGAAHGRPPQAPAAQREPPIDKRPELLADSARRARLGGIELIAVLVVVAVLVAFAVWFFFFAHNPLLRP